MKKVVIVDAKRSAIGRFGGSLKDISAVEIAATVGRVLLQEVGLDPTLVDEVLIGNVLGAGQGQNIARQVALEAGLSIQTPATTINQVCGSGLQAVILGAQSILAGDNEIVLVGGTENMSQAPYLSLNSRWGQRMGPQVLEDGLLMDGLTDAFSGDHMGVTAEKIATDYQISRQAQDAFAAASQAKAQEALKAGRFMDEIVPIEIPQKKGAPLIFQTDEYPRFDITEADLARLRPAFTKDGTVTAGNSSGINDGAALLLLMTEERAKALDLPILASIKSSASIGVDPGIMGVGPIEASRKALEKAGLKVSDLDLIEGNEAFAAQAICVNEAMGWDLEKVNVNGGAIALGHPIGASGARILVTLLHEMQKRNAHYGLATLCVGGGQGVALVVEA